MPRAPLYVALVLAAGAAFWLSQSQRAKAPAVAPAAAPADAEPGPVLRSGPAPETPAPEAAPPDPAATTTRARAPQPELPAGSPWVQARVRVEVTGTNRKRRAGVLYALPADTPPGTSKRDDGNVVRKNWAGEETLTLDLPEAGSWHIGLRSNEGAAPLAFVRAQAGTTVDTTLRLPELGTITVELDGPLPGGLSKRGPMRAVARGVDHDWVLYPGPGQATRRVSARHLREPVTKLTGIVSERDYVVLLMLPREKPVRAVASARVAPIQYAIEPRSVIARAGETVRFRIREKGTLAVQFSDAVAIAPTNPTWNATIYAQQGDRRERVGSYRPGHGAKVRQIPIAPGSWTLTMDGPYRAAALPQTVEVQPGETTTVEVAVAPDPDALAAMGEDTHDQEPLTPVEVRWNATLGPKTSRPCEVHALGTADGYEQVESEGGDLRTERPFACAFRAMRVKQVYVAVLPWHAGRVVRPAARYELTPQPAGYVVAVPEQPVPRNLGRLHVGLADGGLLPLAEQHEGMADVGLDFLRTRQPVRTGTLLGPLPAGDYDFDIWLGGRRIRRIPCKVVAGRMRPLVIPISD